MVKIKCCICGTEYEGDFDDECPKCLWANSGVEEQLYDESEKDAYNLMSRAEAKRNYAKGLNIFGDRLKST